MDKMTITMQDMRRVDFCAAGVEAFFLGEGVDYADFLAHGGDCEVRFKTGRVFARKCINAAIAARQGDK